MSAADDSGKAEPARPLSRAERISVQISVTQTVLAVAGIFIGSVALYAALTESKAVRMQTEASAWPHVAATFANYGKPGEERVDILVANTGAGLARIDAIDVRLDGVAQKSWYEIAKILSGKDSVGLSDQGIADTVIPAGEEITLMSAERQYAGLDAVTAYRDALRDERIVIEICYCSVFDECWVRRTTERKPQPVDQCAAPAVETEF